MELALTTSLRRGCFLGVVVLVAAGLVVTAARYAWAERLARQADNPAAWERAAELEPGNANHWYRLAWFYQNDFQHLNYERSIGYYQRALEANPRSALLWTEAAAAYEAAERPQQARAAYLRARAEHPISAEVAWRYGNFLLRQGQLEEAFAEIRRSLQTEPARVPGVRLAVSLTWRASGDAGRVLREVLPARQQAYLEALDYFVSQGELEAARVAWGSVLELGETIALRRSTPLVDALLAVGQIDAAWEIWQQALVAAGELNTGAAPPRVWDGGFARPAANGGFGWRLHPLEGTDYAFDDGVFRSAPRSLRIRFDGTRNLAFEHVWTLAPVEPGRTYRMEAFLRTEGLSTDSGIHFWLADARDRTALNLSTPAIIGTQPWSLDELIFTAGPETRLVRIALRRMPSRKFDNKLRGAVWLDDVSLEPWTRPGAAR